MSVRRCMIALGVGLVLATGAGSARAATFLVNSDRDEGDASPGDGACDIQQNLHANPPIGAIGICTLRAAIEEANALSGAQVIEIMPGKPVNVSSPLPALTNPTTVRTAGTAPAVIRWAGTGSSGDALAFTGGGSTVQRLVILGFVDGAAVHFRNKGGNHLLASFIGIDDAGVAGPNFDGVEIDNIADNVIGGVTPASRNVISANQGSGIVVRGAGARLNTIVGNYIGLDPTGSAAAGNKGAGIWIDAGPDNRIGGTTVAERNVISANAARGVYIRGGNGNRVFGNYIGLDASGTNSLGNTGAGVEVENAANTLIGAPAPAKNVPSVQPNTATVVGDAAWPTGGTPPGNVIAGNTGVGIYINGAASVANHVNGNFIGVDFNGLFRRPNAGGVTIVDGGSNLVGEPKSGAGNLIAGNSLQGIFIKNGSGNLIQNNWIGVAYDGTTPLPNQLGGVQVQDAPSTVIGGDADAARNLISGNGLSGTSAYGVYIGGTTTAGSRVQGNIIGLSNKGDAVLANSGSGIVLSNAKTVLVGGVNDPAHNTFPRNLISGNLEQGVAILSGSNDIRVLGNYIGSDRTGTVSLRLATHPSKQQTGVWISSSDNNHVGDTQPGARNLISANNSEGVLISGVQATDNVVEGNYIGTDILGTNQIGNALAGVAIVSAPRNTIGGSTPTPGTGPGNLISGNKASQKGGAVQVQGLASTGNKIFGNLIGTQADGKTPLPNQYDGVFIGDSASDTEVGSRTKQDGNVIAFNARAGVVIDRNTTGAQPVGNEILSNNIHGNTELGIDLGLDGITQNPVRLMHGPVTPPTTGPNLLRQTPTLFLVPGTGVATVEGPPNQVVTLQFFASSRGHLYGYGEGERLIRTVDVTTDADGFASAKIVLPGGGDVLSATATDIQGNTSEFSKLPCGTAPLALSAIDPSLIDTDMQVQAEWGDAAIAHQAASILFPGRTIIPIGQGKQRTIELKLQISRANAQPDDDLAKAFVYVTARNLGASAPVAEASILPEQQPFDHSGKATLIVNLDSLMTSLAGDVNRDFFEADVRVCYRGKVQSAQSAKLLHILREKLIVFLPGVLGSEIAVTQAGKTTQAFPTLSSNAKLLSMTVPGKPDFAAAQLDLFSSYLGKSVYRVEQVLQDALKAEQLPDMAIDGKPIGYFYLVKWPYDWRLRLADHVAALAANQNLPAFAPYKAPPGVADILNQWPVKHPEDAPYLDSKVALAGHSTGGLIIRSALTDPQSAAKLKNVDRAFFINTPFLGAPKAYYTFLTGDMGGGVSFFISQATMRDLAPNMPVMYHLAPTNAYQDEPTKNVVAIYGIGPKPTSKTRIPAPKQAIDYMKDVVSLAKSKPWDPGLSKEADDFHDSIRGRPLAIGWNNALVFWSEGKTPDTRGPVRVTGPTASKITISSDLTLGDQTVPSDSQVGGVPQYVTKKHPDLVAPSHVEAANDLRMWREIVDELSAPAERDFGPGTPLDNLPSNAAPGSCQGTDRADAIRAAEAFGESQMDARAQVLSYLAMLPPIPTRTYRQGFDAVYCDGKLVADLAALGQTCQGTLVIGEAKGGYIGANLEYVLGSGYGYRQGTIEWAGHAARGMVQNAQDPSQIDEANGYLAGLASREHVRIEVFHAECVSVYPAKKPTPLPISLRFRRYASDTYPH